MKEKLIGFLLYIKDFQKIKIYNQKSTKISETYTKYK